MNDAKPTTAAASTPAGEANGVKSPSPRPGLGIPQINLPKGGGAIRGIGEKFAANPVTGTGSMTVPIATSPGRSGFGPQLSLSYDSGAGNGPFGSGWSLSLPSITRKTDKGLPKYQDAAESDVFILSGAEDLVPVLVKDTDGNWKREVQSRTVSGITYSIQRYRPRIEGLFARIERWTKVGNPGDTPDVFWRSISKDNITTWYGRTPESRIADPADPSRIFSWLICETRDDKGNGILYEYKSEDGAGVDLTQANERNRGGLDDPRRTANRYLKRILYGNRRTLLDNEARRPPFLSQDQLDSAGWMFEVVFDYGEHDPAVPTPNDNGTWPVRNDPFSSYRAGFEVRTYRLCQRVLMFHHIPNVAEDRARDVAASDGYDGLVRSTDFNYSYEKYPKDARNPIYSFLVSVTQTGYKRQGGGYLQKSLPPVEFGYTDASVDPTVHTVDPESLENLPIGLDGSAYQWVDLDGEGLSGILTEQAGAWFYKRNISPIPPRDSSGAELPIEARFGPVELVSPQPTLSIASGHAQFMDLAGDGQPDVVQMSGTLRGFFERTEDAGWETFRAFRSWPNIDPQDPNLRFVDLDGDGHADVLISEDNVFRWHPSLAEDGFGPEERAAQSFDEETGPHLVFDDGTQSIYLADLSGDGLSDLVRVRNGEVCYWPNLGYGRFGAKVTMDNSPWFDALDLFEQRRIRLADIDGSGTTDIIYLHSKGPHLYFNQSGNSWSPPHQLAGFSTVDNLASVQVGDLLANGTACLVWSSPLPDNGGRHMRYVDLMGGKKPHLLIKTTNNLGAETRVEYSPSTKFYLQDKQNGKPWVTKLPFPVHVVERVITYDYVSRNRFVTRYAYHHGYFDGPEREFRGFGCVEQWDTEQFTALKADGTLPPDSNSDPASHVPPVRTVTWFHTGAFIDEDRISQHMAHEYFGAPAEALLPDTILPNGALLPNGSRDRTVLLTTDELREAVRTLKGFILRQEIYAEDGSAKAALPYTVSERNYAIECLQPRGSDNRHAVFFAHPREIIDYHYERNPNDPRIGHSLVLEVDGCGNVLKSLTIGYGRKQSDLTEQRDKDKQITKLITYTENRVAIDPLTYIIDTTDNCRTPLPCETKTYELTGFKPENNAARFSFEELTRNEFALPTLATEIQYEQQADNVSQQKRLIEHVRTLYRKADLTALLPLGEVDQLALPGENYRLAFTLGLLSQVFQRDGQSLLPDPAAVLGGQAGNQGGYLQSQALKADGRFPASDSDDHWWIPSGRSFFTPNSAHDPATELTQARQHFFVPCRYRGPFGQDALVHFDTNDLLIVETRDALGNRVAVDVNDYRVLQPRLVSDPNRNRTEIALDALGMVVGTAVMGKPPPAPEEGDTLAGFTVDLTQSELDAFFDGADPHAVTPRLLQGGTTRIVYDLDRFRRTRQAYQNDPGKWQPACAATLARETHVNAGQPPQGLKIQINFSYSDGFGREIQRKIQAEPGPLIENGPVVSPRWVGTSWTIFNNKGKPVRQYEPFFSKRQQPDGTLFSDHRFEFGVTVGVSPVLFYDSAGRVIATLHPNHSYEKAVFDPWQQTTYDVNDTCARRNDQTGDPRTDPDIGGYVVEYFKTQPVIWQTWHAQRIGGALGQDERNAAQRAEAHADTPTTAHFDTLGRPFLTVVRNRVVCAGHDLDGTEDSFHTRIELDIEGNQRAVRDAITKTRARDSQGSIVEVDDPLGRTVMRYAYDMLGNRVHQHSMEAGARWMVDDVAGKPIRVWDSRGHNLATTYDALRRSVEQTVRGTTTECDPRTLGRDILVDKIEYGEPPANATPAEEERAQQLNLRTRIFRHFDSAGVATNARLDANGNPIEAYDFKGNLLRSTRRLVRDYTAIPDWLLNPQLDDETFEGSTRYDALNRPIQSVAPHSSLARAKRNVIQPVFNEANLLERVNVWLERAAEPAALLDPNSEAPSPVGVNNIDYDAKGSAPAYRLQERHRHLLQLRSTHLPAHAVAHQAQCRGRFPW
jgi:YD repeat-containing protein